jgi:hypothetical protein
VTLPIDYEGQQLDTFTMKEMGIQFPVLASDGGQPQPMNVRNPDYEPPRGMPQGAEIDPALLGMPGIPGIPGFSGGVFPPASVSKSGTGATGANGKGAADDAAVKENLPFFQVKRYDFIVQFCWKEKRLSERLKEREELRKKQAELEAAKPPSETAPGDTPPGDTPPSDTQPKPADETPPSDTQPKPPTETQPAESTGAETPKTSGGEN